MPFFLSDPEGPALEDIDRHWRAVRYSPEIHRHGEFGDYDVRASLPGVTVPVLVITGRDDRITRPQESEEIAALLGRSYNAVRKLWARALDRLQDELGPPP